MLTNDAVVIFKKFVPNYPRLFVRHSPCSMNYEVPLVGQGLKSLFKRIEFQSGLCPLHTFQDGKEICCGGILRKLHLQL